MMHLYHGSTDLIRIPEYGAGRRHNDYGPGFYCTESEELAKEWACSSLEDGIANHYILNDDNLSILNLNTEEYSILNWITLLIGNRIFKIDTPIAGRARRYLQENFMVNVNAYDIIVGYRADDKYYDFASAFLNNSITVEQLTRAMKLGKLGEQVVLKSQNAFNNIEFVDCALADKAIYLPKRISRNEEADAEFRRICDEEPDGLFMVDILRGKIKNDDERIPRNISE